MAGQAKRAESGLAAGAVARIAVRTTRRTELIQISEQVQELVEQSVVESGVCYVYVPHTTAGVIINEGYDPDVAGDMEIAFDRMVPRDAGYHHAEGNSDSHIKATMVGSSQTAGIEGGRL